MKYFHKHVLIFGLGLLAFGLQCLHAQAPIEVIQIKDFQLKFGKFINLLDAREAFRLERGAAALQDAKAIEFDGFNDYGILEVDSGCFTKFTLVLEVKVGALFQRESTTLFSSQNNPSGNPQISEGSFQIELDGSTRGRYLLSYIQQGATHRLDMGAVNGDWQQLIITFDGQSFQSFLDGNSTAISHPCPGATRHSTHLVLGRSREARVGFFFEGQVRILQLYRGAMNPDRVKWEAHN